MRDFKSDFKPEPQTDGNRAGVNLISPWQYFPGRTAADGKAIMFSPQVSSYDISASVVGLSVLTLCVQLIHIPAEKLPFAGLEHLSLKARYKPTISLLVN